MVVRVRVPLAALILKHSVMKQLLFLSATATLAIAITSCSKMGALSADNFSVTPTPLEVHAGEVAATINGTFPEKYMKRKATVTIVPELRYGGQTTKGAGATFQGENVAGNNQTISYTLGGRFNMKTSYDYVDAMHESELWLTFTAKKGSKTYDVPAVKVADGVIATSQLYKKTILTDMGCIAPDTFQRVSEKQQEANIRFLVNQAEVRKSELQSNSVAAFVQMLKKINDERETMNIQNVEVQAYASPEGGVEYNDRLAQKRQETSSEYVKQQLKASDISTPIDAHYTAQDWEGFQQLVQASNIQDKDVILRVLSMYKDPEEREQQIRNMSAAFQELTYGILPELRRARLIINYEIIGRSDYQIVTQLEEDPTKLSADELLYAAYLEKNIDNKEAIYKKTAELYDLDYRAYNNIAAIMMAKGDKAAASAYLTQALRLAPNAAEPNANKGLLALVDGNVYDAETYIAKASTSDNVGYALGALNIAKGNYAQAEADFGDTNSNTAALAQLLNKNYSAAVTTLDKADVKNGMTSYLHAVAAARQGNKFATSSYLREALSLDPSLQSYADSDLELSILK